MISIKLIKIPPKKKILNFKYQHLINQINQEQHILKENFYPIFGLKNYKMLQKFMQLMNFVVTKIVILQFQYFIFLLKN
jgi:hypothetical protein